MINYMDSNGYRKVTPTPRGNVLSSSPVLGLTSGYIERGKHLMPKQGTRAPWIYYQNYMKDVWTLCVKPVLNEEIVFK
jgi:monooxygenase